MLATIAAVIVVLDPDGLAKICEFDSDRREQFFSGAPGIAV